MKRVNIFASPQEDAQRVKRTLTQQLIKCNIEVVQDNEEFDYLITIGGDGTLLAAFHQYKQVINRIQFIGIHTGHLGFYADWQVHEISELVNGLQQATQEDVVTYPLLEVEVTFCNGEKITELALNECSLRSHIGTMVSDVYISERFFETLRSDGICIATPTGSTGLNKSLGGAVIHPSLDALQLTEIASLNNRIYRSLGSPMIISKEASFTIVPSIHAQTTEFVLMIDHEVYQLECIESLKCRIASERIRFAGIRHTHFWNRVEASFIGRKNNQ